MNDFINLMQEDVKHIDPEKQAFLKNGLEQIANLNDTITIHGPYLCGRDYLKLNPAATNKLFMFRPHVQNAKLPHNITNYSLFVETCDQDIFTNYKKTLTSILTKESCINDKTRLLEMLYEQQQQQPLNIFSWSNTGILLDNIIQDPIFINANIITYGSPILVKKGPCQKCINIYHQDDWILGLLQMVYGGFDFSAVKKNVVHKTSMNQEFIILSRACFQHSAAAQTPHRAFDIFL